MSSWNRWKFRRSYGRPVPFWNGSWGSDSILWDTWSRSRCLQVTESYLCMRVMCLNSVYGESVAAKECGFKLFFLYFSACSRRVSYVSCLAAPPDMSWIPLNVSNGTKCQCLCNWFPPTASIVSGARWTVFFTTTWIYAFGEPNCYLVSIISFDSVWHELWELKRWAETWTAKCR